MKSKSLNIVFMGTPDFAVKSLEVLINSKHNLLAVVTSEDKKAGRGKKIKASEIKNFSIKNKLKIYQPSNLKDESFINEIESLKPDVIIVVAFRMLPKILWKIPRLGTINLHASILPNLRGAAPIHWSIINGLEETGVTTFFINEKIDCGKIIEQSKIKIERNDNTGILYNKLKIIGSKLLISTLDLIQTKDFKTINQDFSKDYLLAPKLTKLNTRINWNANSETIHNKIRGLSPYPVAWSKIKKNDKILKIYKSKLTSKKPSETTIPGKIIFDKNFIYVTTNNYLIEILELQIQGKRVMNNIEFSNGYKILKNHQLH